MKPQIFIETALMRWQNWGNKFIEIRLTINQFVIILMAGMIVILSINLSKANKDINPSDTQAIYVEAITNTPMAEALPAQLPVTEIIDNNIQFSTREAKQDSAYIRRFQQIAIAEMDKYGIPASISMAQGILESNAGNSRLATEANNHFGVKCKQRNCPKGHCMNYHDNSHKDFFVKYNNAWESWRDHSKLLANPDWRYAYMIKDCGNDYACWAKGLKAKGYAYPGKTYDKKLIDIIEKYQLHKLDSRQLLLN